MNESKETQYPYISYSILGTILIFLLFQVSGLFFSTLTFDNKLFHPLLQGFTQITFMLLPTLILASKSPLGLKNLLRINFSLNKNQILYSMLGVLGLQLISLSWSPIQDKLIPSELMGSYNEIKDLIEKQYSDIINGTSIFDFIQSISIAAIIPAFTEELLFRGFLQNSLEQRLRPYTAIMLTSIIFAFFHFNPVNLIPLYIIGVYLGITAFASKSIFLPILIHFAYNAILVISIYFLSSVTENDSPEELELIIAIPMLLMGISITALSALMIIKPKLITRMEI
jgi:uncharacterized protein